MDSILTLERAAAAHWRGTEEEWLGDWLLRAADGYTGRANSALPLGPPGVPLDDALAALTRWYRDRALPPMIAVPAALDGDPAGRAPDGDPAGRALDDELASRGWQLRQGPAFFMVGDVPPAAVPAALPDGLEAHADAAPDDAWLAAYHYRGSQDPPPVMRTVLTSAADQVFISIRAAGSVLAIARVSVAAGWAGITAVEVSPDRRRSGLGGALTREAFAQAASRGVDRVFLQVEVGNETARRLYERAGFRYSHRYHYRIGPV